MENIKYGSECPKGAGCSLSPLPGPKQDLTPSGAYYLTLPVSDRMQFRNCTIWPSGEVEVAGSGPGWSLGSSPWNRPFQKTEMYGGGYLGGCVLDGM